LCARAEGRVRAQVFKSRAQILSQEREDRDKANKQESDWLKQMKAMGAE
jgi:hypothetical protein